MSGHLGSEPKSVRLTIEWDGRSGEEPYALACARKIERGDHSKLTRVVMIEHLTHQGWTGPEPLTRWERFRIWFWSWRYPPRHRGIPPGPIPPAPPRP